MEKLKELLVETYVLHYELENRFHNGDYTGETENRLRADIIDASALLKGLTEIYVEIRNSYQ